MKLVIVDNNARRLYVQPQQTVLRIEGNAGARSHVELARRDAADAHPMSAITGLGAELAAKAEPADITTAVAAHVAAPDPHPGYLLAAGDTLTGNLAVSGGITIDGRDVSVDGTKLDTVEAGADVTDAANVAAAGAVMNTSMVGGSAGSMMRTGVLPYTYEVLKHQRDSNRDPLPTDDSNAGYWYGSWWINTTSGRIFDCADPTANAAVWVPRRRASERGASSTTSTLTKNDRILRIGTGSGNHTCTLPAVATCTGLDFLIAKTTTDANTITLALDAGDTGAKIYFLGNTPSAGASLTLSDSNGTTRPRWLVWSDGTDWHVG